MQLLRTVCLCFPFLLSACAHLTAPVNPANAALPASAVAAVSAPVAVSAVAAPPQEELPAEPPLPILPNVNLDAQMLMAFVLADIAAQRGRPDLAADAYTGLANATQDPRVAKRAAQLALESRQMPRALAAFKLWQDLEPNSDQPKQMRLTLLISGGKFDDAGQLVKQWLANSPKAAARLLETLPAFLLRSNDKIAALTWMQNVAAPYPDLAEAHWAIAHVAYIADNHSLALQEVKQARTLRPDWDRALLFEAKILLEEQAQAALALLKNYLERYPEHKEARLFYARVLLEQKDYAAARTQFRQLVGTDPGNGEMAFAVALLSLQLGELDSAEKELQATLALGQKDADTIHYYLGQLNEEKKDAMAALTHYRLVQDGEHLFASRLREAILLNQAGKLSEARAVLKAAPAASNQQRVTVILIEAQMLRDADKNSEYYQVVSDAVDKLPSHPQLLYELAMAAEKLGKAEVFEKTLRKLIQLAPDHAHAYNALGYSFLERNVRIEEGVQLVEKAYQLAPDDTSITDSVGWGYYRQGKLEQSIAFLSRAFKANPDPEIAAHLGEVLWVKGQIADAQKVWNAALKAHPDNTLLQVTIKKFIP